jgi:hypothetical protein
MDAARAIGVAPPFGGAAAPDMSEGLTDPLGHVLEEAHRWWQS